MQGLHVVLLRILRFANGRPALLLTSYMPLDTCAGLTEEDFVAFPVLTEAITNRCRIPVVSQRRSVQPILIEGDDAALLDVQPGTLGLWMERVSYTDFRQPVEYGYTLMRGDLCSYVLDVGRAGGRVGRTGRDHAGRQPGTLPQRVPSSGDARS